MTTTKRRPRTSPSTDLVPRIIDPESILVRTALEVLSAHAPDEETPAEAFVICIHCGELSPCAPARNAIEVCLASGTRPGIARHHFDDVERTVYGVAQRAEGSRNGNGPRVPRQPAKATVEVVPGRIRGRVQVDDDDDAQRPGPIRRWMALIEPTAMFAAITKRNGPTIAEPEAYDPDLNADDNFIDGSGWAPTEFDVDDPALYQEHSAAA